MSGQPSAIACLRLATRQLLPDPAAPQLLGPLAGVEVLAPGGVALGGLREGLPLRLGDRLPLHLFAPATAGRVQLLGIEVGEPVVGESVLEHPARLGGRRRTRPTRISSVFA